MAGKGKEFAFRVLSTFVFVPIFIWGLFYPEYHLTELIVIPATIWGMSEFYAMAEKLGAHPLKYWGYSIAVIIGILSIIPAQQPFLWLVLLTWGLMGISFIQSMLLKKSKTEIAVKDYSATLMGIIYVAWPFFLFLKIAQMPAGPWLILWLMAVTWACDIGAYLVGNLIGRHKLCPSVSPGKTVEGLIGGLLLSGLAGWGLFRAFPLDKIPESIGSWPIGGIVLLALAITVVGVYGDLAESIMKRQAGVKDSGNTFTGHGGMLDIVDSLLFTVPVFYFLIQLVQELK